MTTPTNVLVFVLDACSPEVARALAAEGRMPTTSRLLDEATTATLRPPFGIYPGAIWPSLYTGTQPSRHRYGSYETVDPQSYRTVESDPHDARGDRYWDVLSRAGKRVAIVDPPHAYAPPAVNGILLGEWGAHERHLGISSSPPELVDEVLARFGPHPVNCTDLRDERQFSPCDWVLRDPEVGTRTVEEERELAARLLQAVRVRCELSLHYLRRGGWDLFHTQFAETHCVGHQLWHYHDPSHPMHEPDRVAELGDVLADVYAAVDDALAQHLAVAGPDTDVVVLFSHGMGPKYDATLVLDPLLCRLAAADAARGRGSAASRTAKRTWERLPPAARRALGRPLAAGVRRHLRGAPSSTGDWGETRRSRRPYYAVPNTTSTGGVRLNVAGREVAGIVDPADVDAVCAELADRLLEVVNVETGRPVIARVTRLDERMERAPDDRFPDLILEWSRVDLVETVWSPRAGVVHVPDELNRRGDHREQGMLVAAGPSFPTATTLPDVDVIDLAPTVCALLGVEMAGVDGRPMIDVLRHDRPRVDNLDATLDRSRR